MKSVDKIRQISYTIMYKKFEIKGMGIVMLGNVEILHTHTHTHTHTHR